MSPLLHRVTLCFFGVVALLVVSLGGCGGGGGGAPDQTHVLSGEYVYVQATGPAVGPSLRGEVGTAAADGAGTLTFLVGYATEEGALTGPFTPPSRSYQVSVARDLTLVDPASMEVRGRLAADGSIAALASEASPAQAAPAILLLARRRAAPVQAHLTGTWALVSIGRATGAGAQATGLLGTVDVDAAGGVSYSETLRNTDHVIPAIQDLFTPSTLSPTAGGWLQWTNAAATQVYFLGGMSADGNLLFFLTREYSLSRAVLRVLVRKGQASSAADLVGTYGTAIVSGTSGYWVSSPASATLNGSGGGSLSSFGSDPNTLIYAVGQTGDATCLVTGAYGLAGAVGPGGRSLFLGGSTTDGMPPILFVMVR